MNRFAFDARGNLLHYVNDELRATVPPESIELYREGYPDAPAAETPEQAKAPAESGYKAPGYFWQM